MEDEGVAPLKGDCDVGEEAREGLGDVAVDGGGVPARVSTYSAKLAQITPKTPFWAQNSESSRDKFDAAI